MQRYFIRNDTDWTNGHVQITGEDVHHIVRVMRGKTGDQIICVNSQGDAWVSEITNISEGKVTASLRKRLKAQPELPVEVTIVQGLPKGDKFELILQKGTELGASAFLPYKADRSVTVWDDKKMKKKTARFERIVKEASEQSHRTKIPVIMEPATLHELLEKKEAYDAAMFAYEEEAKISEFQSFSSVLKRLEKGMRILVCIGPEGGFSKEEAERFKEQGFYPVRFGPRILRTETAAMYALSSISYHFEELGWKECQK